MTNRNHNGHDHAGARRGGMLLILAGLALAGLAFWLGLRTNSSPVPPPSAQTQTISGEGAQIRRQREAFFRQRLTPILEETTAQNLAAQARALAEIDENFRSYERGIEPFVADMASWGTRFGIIGKTARDYWDRYKNDKQIPTEVRDYVSEKFEKHILASARLEEDSQRALRHFAQDLRANRNVMLAKIQVEIEAARIPVSLDTARFEHQFKEKLTLALQTMPAESVGVLAASFAAGFLAQEGAQIILRKIIIQIGARLAALAATAGAAAAGAAGTGAVAGGAMGTAAEPIGGTIIGAAAGLVLGGLVDLWMSGQFEKNLASQCRDFLEKTKCQLVEGDAVQAGLRPALEETVQAFDSATRKVLVSMIVEVTQ